MVGVDSDSLYRRTHILSPMAWPWVGGRLAPFYIHQMNRVNSRNRSGMMTSLYIYIYIVIIIINIVRQDGSPIILVFPVLNVFAKFRRGLRMSVRNWPINLTGIKLQNFNRIRVLIIFSAQNVIKNVLKINEL